MAELFWALRRRLADLLIGPYRTVLYAPRKYQDAIKAGDYLSLPDHILAAATRRWFTTIGQVTKERANEKSIPVSVFVTSSSVLTLAQHMKNVGATTMKIVSTGTVDGGRTPDEDFYLTLTRGPADALIWDDGRPSVEETYDDDGNLVCLRYRINFGDK